VKTAEELVEAHRRCPLCWGGLRGVGLAVRTAGRTRYYKCKQHVACTHAGDPVEQHGQVISGGCGHNWSVQLAIVETAFVEKRVVPVSIRDVQIEQRSNNSR
jgi:hypothetical protein